MTATLKKDRNTAEKKVRFFGYLFKTGHSHLIFFFTHSSIHCGTMERTVKEAKRKLFAEIYIDFFTRFLFICANQC